MEQKKFYRIIDLHADEWYIDANTPVRGTWKNKDGQKGPRRKTNQKGEVNEINTTSGEVQVIHWAKPERMCVQCCHMVKDRIELINIKTCQVKCSCGMKYPLVDHVLKKVDEDGSQGYRIDQKVWN